jgi:hypothetical protein
MIWSIPVGGRMFERVVTRANLTVRYSLKDILILCYVSISARVGRDSLVGTATR